MTYSNFPTNNLPMTMEVLELKSTKGVLFHCFVDDSTKQHMSDDVVEALRSMLDSSSLDSSGFVKIVAESDTTGAITISVDQVEMVEQDVNVNNPCTPKAKKKCDINTPEAFKGKTLRKSPSCSKALGFGSSRDISAGGDDRDLAHPLDSDTSPMQDYSLGTLSTEVNLLSVNGAGADQRGKDTPFVTVSKDELQ